MNEKKSDLLSNEFKVACEIFLFNDEGKKVWFTNLVESLKDEMGQTTVMNSLRTLFDWGIVQAEFGETGKGRAGRLLYISGESKDTIRQVCEAYWKPRRR